MATKSVVTDKEELPDRLQSIVDNRSISKENSWNSEQCCSDHSHDELPSNIPTKHRSGGRKSSEKAMIKEYKLAESVVNMVQQYEEKSRVESEQDTCNLERNKHAALSTSN